MALYGTVLKLRTHVEAKGGSKGTFLHLTSTRLERRRRPRGGGGGAFFEPHDFDASTSQLGPAREAHGAAVCPTLVALVSSGLGQEALTRA